MTGLSSLWEDHATDTIPMSMLCQVCVSEALENGAKHFPNQGAVPRPDWLRSGLCMPLPHLLYEFQQIHRPLNDGDKAVFVKFGGLLVWAVYYHLIELDYVPLDCGKTVRELFF